MMKLMSLMRRIAAMSSRCRLRDCKHTRFVRVPYAVLQHFGYATELKREREKYLASLPLFKWDLKSEQLAVSKWRRKLEA
jgi:hypothetical protein